MSDLSTEVRRRAAGLCEYCRIPEAAFRRPFHIEHVIARQHGGETEMDNLALACWACNLKKGPNLTGIDPESKRITPLFDPRKDRWVDLLLSVWELCCCRYRDPRPDRSRAYHGHGARNE